MHPDQSEGWFRRSMNSHKRWLHKSKPEATQSGRLSGSAASISPSFRVLKAGPLAAGYWHRTTHGHRHSTNFYTAPTFGQVQGITASTLGQSANSDPAHVEAMDLRYGHTGTSTAS